LLNQVIDRFMPIAKKTISLTPHARLLAAAFLWGTSASQLTALVVGWCASGVDPRAISLILSSSTAAVLVSSVVAGWLMSRMAIGRVLTLGASMALFGIVALPFAAPMAAALAKACQGGGFGVFLPAAVLCAKARADADGQASHAGMVTAALLAPMAFGPTLGAWALGAGRWPFLASTALPMIGALLLVHRLHVVAEAQSSAAVGYAALLRDRRLWLPCASTVQSGLGYGFAVTFLPLMLANWGVPVAAFFGPFTVVLLVTRSYGLNHLRVLAAPMQVMLGLSACALAFGLLLLGEVAAAACLLALGYGIVYPAAAEWASSLHPANGRARPVALVTASFHLGSIIVAQATGWMLPLGWCHVLGALSLVYLVGISSQLVVARVAAGRELTAARPRGGQNYCRWAQ
jgi:Major Facilitator Superfamily